jgi:glycosyltransferase involved in cell wall biosynthesis
VVKLPQLDWRLRDRLRSRLGDEGAFHRHHARVIAAAVREATGTYALDTVILEETNGWAGLVAGQVSVPVIITLHGPWLLLHSAQSGGATKTDLGRLRRESRAFATAAGLLAPSRNVLAAIERQTSLPPDQPRRVIPNALAADPAAPLAAQGPVQDILFVGRFDRLKGADTVLAAFSLLSETHSEARLTFVGPDQGVRQADGSLLHMDAALAALSDATAARIDYRGPLSRVEVAALRDTHAIALIASRYENLNYTMLEAMVAGQAIVSTEVGGPAEVLENGRTALLVPPGDAEAMADALRHLLEAPERARQLAGAGRDTLLRDFSPEGIAGQTLDFARTVLAKAPH